MKKTLLLIALFVQFAFVSAQQIGIEKNGEIILYNDYPSTFITNEGNTVLNYNKSDVARFYDDGFREYIRPVYNSSIEKLGDVYFDEANNIFTNYVIALTESEIQDKLMSISEVLKQSLIQAKLEEEVLQEAQSSDDTEALDNQYLYPIWEAGIDYSIDHKVQHFTADNQLVLYKCVQAHTSQSDWQPKDVPALFTRVAYPNEILDFVQPTGAQDTYQSGDRVYFPIGSTTIYESTIDNNAYSPTSYPAGWLLIE